jgi:hypothetical protein
MTEKDPEYLAFLDSLIERCLLRISVPSRDHFLDVREKMPKLQRMTNYQDKAAILASVRRLVRSGRITRATRSFAGHTVHGIICLPHCERKSETIPTELNLTPQDVELLHRFGIAVDEEFAAVR